MKLFAFITLINAILLFSSNPFGVKKNISKKEIPPFLKQYEKKFKHSFNRPQNGHFAWAMITGEKNGFSPKLKSDLNHLELNFILSPAGLHLGIWLSLCLFIFKKIKNKKKFKIIKIGILVCAYGLPFLAIKRIIIFRLLTIFKHSTNKNWPVEHIFFLTFIISLILGHYLESALSFILSFLYIGTFISLRHQPRIILLMGLFSSHLLVAFFSGNQVSFLALILNMIIVPLFSLLLPFLYLYFFTFKLIAFNWIEPIIRAFIVMIHWEAKITAPTFTSATFFLILAVWVILLKQRKIFLIPLLLLHGNLAHCPSIFIN